MAWVKIDDNFPDHPKILRIGLPAIVLQIRALCYASRHLTDGFISTKVEANLLEGFNEWFDDTLVNTNLLADEMVKAGLWEKAEGGYIIHENPHSGWSNHGFYSFHPTLFHDFYTTNGFSVEQCLLVARNGETQVPPSLTKRFGVSGTADLNVFCVAKRTKIQSFVFPVQTKYAESIPAAEVRALQATGA